MDEAGHALEVDVLIPLSGFLRSTRCSMVLAGDPKQLGPVVRSPYAMALGYGWFLTFFGFMFRNFFSNRPIHICKSTNHL